MSELAPSSVPNAAPEDARSVPSPFWQAAVGVAVILVAA
ncbi:MAG: tripartite tricarboxylate transporter TctB family protein, partial [Proteobacteria bacterium]|nr:tripartite tricarboxylate transporter TctB family protein [Pseudomonadota bacterium]